MLNKLAVPNLTMATNIESVQSEVSVEEIEVIMDDALCKNKYIILFWIYFKCSVGITFLTEHYKLGFQKLSPVLSNESEMKKIMFHYQ